MCETKKLMERNDSIYIKLEVELPIEYHPFFEYLELYFNQKPKTYLEFIIKREIESRNSELHFF